MKNILLIAPPRSRSSMVAAIFKAHGWNTPTQAVCPAYPLGKCENTTVSEILRPGGSLLKDYRTLLEQGPEAFRTTAKWEEIEPHLVEPWIVKVDPFCLRSFEGASACPIRVYRKPRAMVESSAIKDLRFTLLEWKAIAEIYWKEMSVFDNFDGPRILTDDLIEKQGDEMTSLEKGINFLGGNFSLEKTLDCIKEIPK